MTNAISRYALPGPVKARFMVWWSRLQDEKADGTVRADRAALRRAHDLTAVACAPAYQRIYRELAAAHPGAEWVPWQQERLAAVVGLAAHVTARSDLSLPHAMSQRPEGSDRNLVSELRFARLLDAPDIEALFSGLRRLLPLIGHKTDPEALATDVFGWGDETRKRWAYAYRWTDKT
ncbi:type I-E CRISPR-associated protein Cse2/CasB [Piscinibacter sp.]|uniref:type I-E CRISPR-associated protein Cse2/CasB n=1 Tax=Piscinibacter sp. TaxID=1903157 RepID=UPI0039E4BB3A